MGTSHKDWNTVSVVGANEYPFAELQNVPVFSLVFLLSTRHCFPGRLVSFELDFGLLISVSCFEIAVFYFPEPRVAFAWIFFETETFLRCCLSRISPQLRLAAVRKLHLSSE
ncbi:hypothetical protein RvY_16258 [Ramazzottius varieornatus]|uniref:Uncharacterized protein n=1 Tax=Ramazzottius varieornatus TaxID=947166 RepID=A0A1D1VXU0_RAMVA|nr:hypothetical protein RvY_16258 [Ramazzottius varieornatus]